MKGEKMGFFIGTGPSFENDSLNQIQVESVLNGQEKRLKEALGQIEIIPPIPILPNKEKHENYS